MTDQWVLEEREPTERELLYKKAHEEMIERVKQYDDRIVTTLKGHLSLEQSLNDLLRKANRRLRRRTCAGKIDVAQKLFLPDLSVELWDIVKAGNNLRNAVAHGHKQGTVEQRVVELKKALLAWASPSQRPGIEAMTEPQMISTAFNQTGSFIVVANMKLEEEQKKKG